MFQRLQKIVAFIFIIFSSIKLLRGNNIPGAKLIFYSIIFTFIGTVISVFYALVLNIEENIIIEAAAHNRRFDEIFFVDLPNKKVRKEIFTIHLQKRKREPDKFDLDALAKSSDGYSGSEIEQAIVSALHEAYANKCSMSTEIIVSALKNSPPITVTLAENIEYLRKWADGRCVPAD